MNKTTAPVAVQEVFTRSINLLRDRDNEELLAAYVLTAKALQTLELIAQSMTSAAGSERSFALIGPYGSGKSAFALYLSALLSSSHNQAHGLAIAKLDILSPTLANQFQQSVGEKQGFLRVVVSGLPDSLIRQLLLALAQAVGESSGFSEKLKDTLYNAPLMVDTNAPTARDGGNAAVGQEPARHRTMDNVLSLIASVQDEWAERGGSGVLIVIDELGKFLEYESYHPQHREIHLLQLLAEHARQQHAAPLYLVVLLHQAFEYYSHRLGKQLREEWQKVQGRYHAIAFIEPAEQTLRVMATAFMQNRALPETVRQQLSVCTEKLGQLNALPINLTEQEALRIFHCCYPLHPITILILPILCQKIAQNERTLFSYLGSNETYGFKALLERQPDTWILPASLYDYFIEQHTDSFSDPLTYRRWLEVVTALERFDAEPDAPAIALLKTIGLLNLIGSQRGLKPSYELLHTLFGNAIDTLLERLSSASIVHFRQYNQDYKVWQGSDFDLNAALASVVVELAEQPIVPILNSLSPIKPIVARRVTIDSGSLRSFKLVFAARGYPYPKQDNELTITLYLADEGEEGFETKFSDQDIVAVCGFAEHEPLREALLNKMALTELPKRHAALHEDPVAHREYLTWLAHAEIEAGGSVYMLLSEPERLQWYFNGKSQVIRSRRDLQEQLSHWVETSCYPKALRLRNELIMWDQPSASANTGRNRLINAMLLAATQENLGITKTPAEKSLYLSLLKDSRLHRRQQGLWGIYPPEAECDPCRLEPVWSAINARLGDSGKQIPVSSVPTAKGQALRHQTRRVAGAVDCLLAGVSAGSRLVPRRYLLRPVDNGTSGIAVQAAGIICRGTV